MRRALLLAASLLWMPIALSGESLHQPAAGAITLQQAVTLALRQNPEILRGIAEIQRTRGQVIEVRAEALPTIANISQYSQLDPALIQGGGGAGAGGSLSAFNFFRDKSWRVTFEIRQTLYSGGRVRAALKIAELTQDASVQQLKETVARVIATVRTQFYNALLNRELITVAEQNLRLLGDELRDQQNRFEAGTVPRFNVLRAEVELANSRPDLIRAKNNFHISQLELTRSLGLDARTQLSVVGELRMPARDLNLAGALETARKNRPLLRAQQDNVETEQQQIKVARAGYMPSLDANFGYEMLNSRNTDDLTKITNGWFLGFTGRWNIFDGFATKGRIDQAKARLQSAEVGLADSVRQVEIEVQRAHARAREARQVIESQRKVVEQAEEALRLAVERLAAGAGTQLDVLDANVALTLARTTQKQALADYNVALAEYDRSVGAENFFDDSIPSLKAASLATPSRLEKARRAEIIGAD